MYDIVYIYTVHASSNLAEGRFCIKITFQAFVVFRWIVCIDSELEKVNILNLDRTNLIKKKTTFALSREPVIRKEVKTFFFLNLLDKILMFALVP